MEATIQINGRFLTQSMTGVQRYANEFCKALDHLIADEDPAVSGLRFEVAAPAKGELRRPAFSRLPIHRFGRLKGHLWEQLELPKATCELLFCPGNTAPVSRLLRGQPTIVTVHDLSYRYFPRAYSRAFRMLYHSVIPCVFKWASAVLTVSETERSSILRYYPDASPRIHAIPNGAMANDSIRHSGPTRFLPTETGYVLYVGSLSRRKNLQGFLKAAAKVAERTSVSFVVVGATTKTFSTRQFRIAESLRSRIEFRGQVDQTEDLVDLYRNAGCLVFPSFYESSGLPPTEAMACGCPVIVSTIPALKERCGDAALYCDPTSPANIAETITTLLDDTALQRQLRDRGFARVRQFTWENCVRQSLAVFDDVLGIERKRQRLAA